MSWDPVRRARDVALHYTWEALAFTGGVCLLVGLAGLVVAILSVATVGFTATAIREEAAYLVGNLRRRRTGRED